MIKRLQLCVGGPARTWWVLWLGCTVTLVTGLFFLARPTEAELSENPASGWTFGPYVVPPINPNLHFCGERVPLEQTFIKQQLEAELIFNMYSVPATLLILKRAPMWQDTMSRILEQAGVPADFFYLMLAESGGRNVRSPAGAQGFWQFMPQTAKEYGLRVDDFVDFRNDPIRSTVAAAQYLRKAYERFGNWTITAASYNMGMAGIANSMAYQKQKNYHDLYLNSETMRYVYRILALKCIVESPSTYGYELGPDDSYQLPPCQAVAVNGPVNWIEFAQSNKTTFKVLRFLNPWIDSSNLNTTGGQTYWVLIPKN